MKPIGRPDWRDGGARTAAAESAVLSALLLLAVYVLWDMGFLLNVRVTSWVERADGLVLHFVPWQPVLAVGVGLVAYWALLALGRDRIAFWLTAFPVAAPHALAAWSHNRIGWHELLEFQEDLVDERSVYGDMTLFVLCLVGLVVLHRIIGIKRLERLLRLQGVDPGEKRVVIRYENLMLIGLIVAGLLVAGLMVMVAEVLGRYDGLLDGSSLTMATVGGGAALLLALTLLLWFRGRQDGLNEEGAIRPEATDGS